MYPGQTLEFTEKYKNYDVFTDPVLKELLNHNAVEPCIVNTSIKDNSLSVKTMSLSQVNSIETTTNNKRNNN